VNETKPGDERRQRLAARTVLIVDDQPQVRSVLEEALRGAGASVLTAEDGAGALDVVTSSRPELILLDVYMPNMDGWQFLERLARLGGRPEPPVVLQTSAEGHADVQRARGLGVAAYVSKPFRLAEVIEMCGRVLDGARPLQGRASAHAPRPHIFVEGPDASVLIQGELLELTVDGAQIDIDAALPRGRTFRFRIEPPEGGRQGFEAEVRWVRSANGRFVHGLQLKRN
jgi:CheY-like chemotaxis protein